VLSGRGLCDELITRPEESYRMCCVVVCDLETSRIGAPYIYDISNLRVNIFLIKHINFFLVVIDPLLLKIQKKNCFVVFIAKLQERRDLVGPLLK